MTEVEWFAKWYYEDGLSVQQIADKLGMAKMTVKRRMVRDGIRLRSGGGRARGFAPRARGMLVRNWRVGTDGEVVGD